MGRLIDIDKAIDAMAKLEQEDIEAYGCSIPECFDSNRAIEALNSIPTVQTAPLKQGHWKDDKCDQCDAPINFYYENCGDVKKIILNYSNYCPNCGAKMAEGSDKE